MGALSEIQRLVSVDADVGVVLVVVGDGDVDADLAGKRDAPHKN